MRALLLLAALGLTACVVDSDWEEFELDRAPFTNQHVARGDATFRVLLAEGYACPDGPAARVYLVEPADEPSVDRPLALLLHGRNFDDPDVGEGLLLDGQVNRLDSAWSELQVEATLGMEAALDGVRDGSGAWVAALLEAGFAVAAPANCWGDLWHGTGRNPYAEGFYRWGTYLARETIGIADAQPGIDASTTVVIGLGEGGRGVTELFRNQVPFAGAIVDSSPDDLSSVLAQPQVNAEAIEALSAIYHDEIRGLEDPIQIQGTLQAALERDSLASAVTTGGFRVPIVYAWSRTDERIDASWAEPAEVAITANYPAGQSLVLEWGETSHAPSNRSLPQARDLTAWMTTTLGLGASAP